MTEILRRKLAVVKRQYGKNPADYERYAVVAAASLYGVELLEDNAEICRRRLFEIWNAEYTANAGEQANDACRNTVRFLFCKNILCGDALTLRQADGSPIVFAEWSLVTGDLVKRRDFRLDVLLDEHPGGSRRGAQLSLFEEDPAASANWTIDPATHDPIPAPVREYPPTDYRRLADDA